MRTHTAIFLCAAFSLFAQPALGAINPLWTKPFPPLRIAGNLYYVGTWDLACYLIVTPQGDVLINTGIGNSAPQIRANIENGSNSGTSGTGAQSGGGIPDLGLKTADQGKSGSAP